MRKLIKRAIAVILCLVCVVQFSGQAFAISFTGKTYVEEVILSYGKTPEEAKEWLKNKGYKILDYNLNEGADDTWSESRAVYLGYKTTMDADKAITDMKLMNMKGNYSVNDYKLLLQEQEASIRFFINNFISAVSEYRENYKNGQTRAVAAHDMLNLLYDDDTGTAIGDLLLEKIKEEYSEEEFASLSKAEQEKHADMTTILMQSNTASVLAIEQIIALATDSGDSVWTERYDGIASYDAMLENLIEAEGFTPSKAAMELSSRYDTDAKAIASKLLEYRAYLMIYSGADVSFASSEEDILAFSKEKGDDVLSSWYIAGTQYEILKSVYDADGVSLLDIITDENNDLEGEDRYLLYPLVSVLTEGQRACLDFLPFYQIVALGINDNAAVKDAMSKIGLKDKGSISIYEGIDRAIFSEKVALTTEANNLQQSTDKDMTQEWFRDGISTSTKALYISLGVTAAASAASAVANSFILRSVRNAQIGWAEEKIISNNIMVKADEMIEANVENIEEAIDNLDRSFSSYSSEGSRDSAKSIISKGLDNDISEAYNKALTANGKSRVWSNLTNYFTIGMACITMVLLAASLWRTYEDLRAYYHVEFSPIPMYLVHQGVDEKDEKVYTYYKAVGCNRQEAQLMNEKTKILEAFGDINGDVGKQWVALYTTTDKAAGEPVTADFSVQYASADIPAERTPLSMFGENAAQNLTNAKRGFTFSDSRNGIYLFYDTDPTAFAGSAISTGVYALIAGVALVVFGIASYLVSEGIRSRKGRREAKHA